MSLLVRAILCLGALSLCAGVQEAQAKTPTEARASAIGWLEAHQNPDGSWGAGGHQPIVTSETLLALAAAGRQNGVAAQRAKGWLLNREYSNVDYMARAIRALEAAGIDMTRAAAELDELGAGLVGFGPTSEDGVTAYDTAVVLAAIDSAGLTAQGMVAKRDEVFSRRRDDGGWSGDLIPVSLGTLPDAESDRTTSAEIVRAMSSYYTDWTQSGTDRYSAQRFLSSEVAAGGSSVGTGSDTLELAARLAGLHSIGMVDDDPVTGIEIELLQDLRFTANDVWSDSDPYVNAIGLLAITTKPGSTWSCQGGDCDADGVPDSTDAFPYDPSESRDLDGDGIGDNADPDRDGDGICDWTASGPEVGACTGIEQSAAFSDDPSESVDSDGDGIGDNDETDADGDGLLDADELELGTDPTRADTDADQILDASDSCPLIAGNVDMDGDGICLPADECDGMADPLDIRNLDGDDLCDEADPDDDDDQFDDHVEIVWGSDPRDGQSTPEDVATTDPGGDFDGDGLTNASETSTYGTSPYLADSDSDGALDGQEEFALGSPTDPLDPASQLPSVIAVTSGAGPSEPSNPLDPHEGAFSGAFVHLTATGGQPTPVAQTDDPQSASSGSLAVHQAGFQPQTTLGRDLDGDGLSGLAEAAQSTSATNVDTDGDDFVDGLGGIVSKAQYSQGYDLDDDAFVEGEMTLGTDPADPEDRIGSAGDVAPLGFPDGQLNAADLLVGSRIADDPGILIDLSPDGQKIAEEAADLDGDQELTIGDVLRIHNEVEASNP